MNKRKSEQEKVFDTIATLLLTAEMYHDGYPFDKDHKKKQVQLFHHAHQLINNMWMDVGKSVGWMTEHDKDGERPREVEDYMDINWSKTS